MTYATYSASLNKINLLRSTTMQNPSFLRQPTTTPRMAGNTWAAVGSTLATLMFISAIIRQFCPQELRRFFEKYTHQVMGFLNPYIQITIHEYSGTQLRPSGTYASVEAYLSKNSSKNAKRLKVETGYGSKKLAITLDEYEIVTDDYQGVTVWWNLGKKTSSPRILTTQPEPERRFYRLKFHQKYRELITESYLDHVVEKGKEIRVLNRQRKLYTNNSSRMPTSKQTMWSHIPFEHPATFQTLAMEPEKKQEIVDDLLTFSRSKEFYAQIGKAWKRGFLLYGPPGTGKSTMISAMANLLGYDVYDLELTSVKDNIELRRLLIETTSKSIVVVEDIDCSLDLTGQRKTKTDKSEKETVEKITNEPRDERDSRVTLSGLLNFIDGLWSASGGERIIVFTTNHVEKLDPALIRRGRMDKHIELSYCSFEGFKVLAKNYLKMEEHSSFESIERLMGEVEITPADVAENLMPKSSREDAEKCLSNLIQALEEAKKEATMKKEKASRTKRSSKETTAVTEIDEEFGVAGSVTEGSQSQEPGK